MVDDKALFDAIRLIKGAPLTQGDVNSINKALMRDIATTANVGMRVSQRGIDLIHSFESLKLTTYPDPGPTGLPVTGGWGSTRDHEGKPFRLGFTADRAYWDALFARDLATVETGVNMLIAGSATTQGQFDAMASFAYNVGLDIDDDDIAEGLGDSTLLRRHRAGDYVSAKAQFLLWNKAKGKVMKGLTNRRTAEAALYAS